MSPSELCITEDTNPRKNISQKCMPNRKTCWVLDHTYIQFPKSDQTDINQLFTYFKPVQQLFIILKMFLTKEECGSSLESDLDFSVPPKTWSFVCKVAWSKIREVEWWKIHAIFEKEESTDHLLIHLDMDCAVLLFSLFGVHLVLPSTVKSALLSWHEPFPGRKRKKVQQATPLCLFWRSSYSSLSFLEGVVGTKYQSLW